MRKRTFAGIMVLGFLLTVTMASPSLAAYSSHQNDEDVNNFLAVYPFAKSTKLDDCSLCHPGGNITEGGKTKSYGSCDYCHITYGLTEPHGTVPLNGYASAYLGAGRGPDALKTIEGSNSDGDSFSNIQEITALTFPGDPKDYPGLTPAPAVVLNQERILKLPDHSEFLFLNASKSADWYARYRGAKIRDLLKSVGIRREATQITVFAPDGFSKTFPIDVPDPQPASDKGYQYDVMGPYPYGQYFGGLDFVEYSFLPGHLYFGNGIPDRLYMLLAYLRDGDPLTKGKLVPDPKNPARLVLDGEGPYRLIPPQKIAGSPDRPSTSAPVGDGWDYDPLKDHNAGASIRSATAIRVEPLPTGTTDFNWIEGGWNLVDQAKLVIYGAIDPRTYHVWGKVTDSNGYPIDSVKITFGLLSLGQAGEDTTGQWGWFHTRLPEGEYRVVPFKEGYTFVPASALISLSERGFELEFTATPTP